jgi:hypothetical protein
MHSTSVLDMHMATRGFFTLHDLYAGKAKQYHHHQISHTPTLSTVEPVDSVLTNVDVLFENVKHRIESSSSIVPMFEQDAQQLVRLGLFAYLHWFLLALAILLSLALVIISIYYCHHHCRTTKRTFKYVIQLNRPSINNDYDD